MERIERLDKALSRTQKETYAKICETNKFTATGHNVRTCNILVQFGLIKPDTDSNKANDYVLKGKPLEFTQALPLKRNVLKSIKQPKETALSQAPEPKHIPIVWPSPAAAPAVYSNTTREQHIDRWLGQPVKGKAKITPIKCLTWSQMDFIMSNHEQKSAQEMADHLGKEKYEVLLFCQTNAIEPYQPKKKRIGYNAQKKTA